MREPPLNRNGVSSTYFIKGHFRLTFPSFWEVEAYKNPDQYQFLGSVRPVFGRPFL